MRAMPRLGESGREDLHGHEAGQATSPVTPQSIPAHSVGSNAPGVLVKQDKGVRR